MSIDLENTVPTLTACEIAGLNRQRFNEFVAAGDYPCAPATEPGKARYFNELDLIALFVFARLVEIPEVSAKRAGRQACAIREKLETDPNAASLKIGDMIAGPYNQPVPSNADILTDRISRRVPLSFTEYNIAAVRELVREDVARLRAQGIAG